MLSVDTLRDHLGAAFCCPEPEIAAYLDALRLRGALPPDGAALDAGHIVSALLVLLSGAPPAEAVDEALRMRAFVSQGFSQRRDASGRAEMEWTRRRGGCNGRLVASRASAGSA